ncbi:hypothetical protein I656_02681 [Geobacillus sp. WSUCF1]|nr:hypothetical protein I656_02681 [Geobacillus sp. WSUCF1]
MLLCQHLVSSLLPYWPEQNDAFYRFDWPFLDKQKRETAPLVTSRAN